MQGNGLLATFRVIGLFLLGFVVGCVSMYLAIKGWP